MPTDSDILQCYYDVILPMLTHSQTCHVIIHLYSPMVSYVTENGLPKCKYTDPCKLILLFGSVVVTARLKVFSVTNFETNY